MNYILGTFEGTVKWGFTFTLPILILAYLVKKIFRPFIKKWLLASYILAFVYCIDIFISRLIDLITALAVIPKNFEGYNFYYSSANLLSTYLYPTYILITIVLFLFKEIRASFFWGIAVLVILHYEAIYIAIASLYSDYHWSSFSEIYHPLFGTNPYLLCFIIFNLLASAIYFSKQFCLKRQQKVV